MPTSLDLKAKCFACFCLVNLALTALSVSAQSPAAPAPAPVVQRIIPATEAAPKEGNATFFKKHESFLARAKSGPIGLLFLGDSITDNWSKAPEIWAKYYDSYQPANFGIGGDRTQHVLWRIEKGELDGIHPRVVVLMLGTNNSASNTAADIAAADKKIVGLIRSKIPEAKVLLLAIFPRGPRKNSDGTMDDGVLRMKVIHEVNAELAKLDDGVKVRFLDINAKFLNADGKIPNDIMPDQLHPNVAGYQIWADAMQPLLTEMMK